MIINHERSDVDVSAKIIFVVQNYKEMNGKFEGEFILKTIRINYQNYYIKTVFMYTNNMHIYPELNTVIVFCDIYKQKTDKLRLLSKVY